MSNFVNMATSYAKWTGRREAVSALNNIVPNQIREQAKQNRAKRDGELQKQNAAAQALAAQSVAGYGGGAVDIMGRPVPTALVLEGGSVIDLAPKIDCSSQRNVVCTQVQGRDYSRKEVLGNGDVTFNVSGKFVHPNMDVYPKDQVSAFITAMRKIGTVSVDNLIFGQHNVTEVVIKDYSLPQSECMNEQPYTFTCVGVEPDQDIELQDTLSTVVINVESDSVDGFFTSVLAKKLAAIAQTQTQLGMGQVENSISSLIGI